MKSVFVMLSAYNGEKYLDEQIKSVLNQEGVTVVLSIRDDGSNDDTRKVLSKYLDNENVYVNYGTNKGYRYSFWEILLNSKECDYYAFCDQDDVWKPKKLINAINKLEEVKQVNKMYCSSMTVVNDKLETQYINEFKKLKLSLGSSMVRQRIAGCTMVFDKKLRDLLLNCDIEKEQSPLTHDMAVYAACCMTGGITIYNNSPDILYRRHDAAVTAYGKGVIQRIKSYIKIFNSDKGRKYKEIEFLNKCLNDYIPLEVKEFITEFLSYKSSYKSTFKLFLDKRISSNIRTLDLLTKLAILLRCL